MATTLYKNEDIESKPSRTFRAVKWALGLVENGCKGAAEVFRKKEEAIDLPPKEWAEATPVHSDSPLNSMVQHLLHDDIEPDTEHCLRCNPEKGNRGRETVNDGYYSAKSDSGDVWAYIAAEVGKAGITIDLVKKRQNTIAQRIIEDLRQEIKREEGKPHLENKKAVREASPEHKQTRRTNPTCGSDPDPIQHIAYVEPALSRQPSSKTGIVKPGTRTFEVENLNATEEASGKLRMGRQSFAQPKTTTNHFHSNVPRATEYNEAVTEQLGYSKSEPVKRDKFYEVVESANHQLRMMLSNIQKLEADENLHPNVSPNGDDSHEHSESEEGSSASSITTVSATSLENAAVQSQTVVKGGRWFETPRGSLERIEDEQRVDERLKDQEATSPTNKISPENKSGSSKNLLASREDNKAANFCDFELLLPNYSQPNSFQVPDIDDTVAGVEQEYPVEEFTQNDDSGEGEESEQGEVHDEISEHSGPNSIDHGNFTLDEVCIALGNGTLDEERIGKLERGFKTMLAEALGIY